MNTIAKIVLFVFGSIFWFGFIGPYCVSSTSNILLWGWPILSLLGFLYLGKITIIFAKEMYEKYYKN
jgi:hypothetical protein